MSVTAFDHFLYGMALANHASQLSENWDEVHSCSDKSAAYTFGIGEHVVYLLFKIVTAVAFIFIAIGLTIHYVSGLATKQDETEMTTRVVRMQLGLLVLGEALLGIFVDMIGLLSPPLAYMTHSCLKEQLTRRAFEKLGIIDHSMPSREFTASGYFSKL